MSFYYPTSHEQSREVVYFLLHYSMICLMAPHISLCLKAFKKEEKDKSLLHTFLELLSPFNDTCRPVNKATAFSLALLTATDSFGPAALTAFCRFGESAVFGFLLSRLVRVDNFGVLPKCSKACRNCQRNRL